MARGLNKFQCIGSLGKEPESTTLQSGIMKTSFSIAINEDYKDKDGNKVEKVEWVNVVTWRKLAEVCAQYLHKGSKVYIEGKISTRNYDDKDGNKKWITEIVAEEMLMLDTKGGNGNNNGGDSNDWYEKEAAKAEAAKQTAPKKPKGQPLSETASDMHDDRSGFINEPSDLPF